MENFTNETIDVLQLPKFEEVVFTSLQPVYWKVIMINIIIFATLLIAGLSISYFLIDEVAENINLIFIATTTLLFLIILFSRISFKKKGYAFREQDVLYRYGIIATSIIVIPYNRVQHIAVHEGLVSRFFGLVNVNVYSAGGISSDIKIPGIDKEQAESIKQLLMTKIQKHL